MELACSYAHQGTPTDELAGDHAGRIAGGGGASGRLVGRAKLPAADCIIVGKLKKDLPIPAYPRSYKSMPPQFGELVFRANIAAR